MPTPRFRYATQGNLLSIVGALVQRVAAVTGVKGSSESGFRTGNVTIAKSDIGLGNVENMSASEIRSGMTKQEVLTAVGDLTWHDIEGESSTQAG